MNDLLSTTATLRKVPYSIKNTKTVLKRKKILFRNQMSFRSCVGVWVGGKPVGGSEEEDGTG